MVRKLFICSMIASAMLSSTTSHAAISEGLAGILLSGGKVVTQQFIAKKDVMLPQVKVELQLTMTVDPKKADQLVKTLKTLKTPGGRKLVVKGIQQSMTSTGLVDLTAQVSGNLPANDLSDLSALINSYNKSGSRLTLTNTTPYFPEKLRQEVENKLAISLYKKAEEFLSSLNDIARPNHYDIGSMSLSESPAVAQAPAMMQRSFAQLSDNNSNLQMQKNVIMYSTVVFIAKK